MEMHDTFESVQYGEFHTGPHTKVTIALTKAKFHGVEGPVWLFTMRKFRLSRWENRWYAVKGSGISFPVECSTHLFDALIEMKEKGIFEWVEKRQRSNDEGTV